MIKTVIRASLVLALVVGLSACGSKAPRPVSELALTDAALQNAEVAGAGEHAPIELREAYEKKEQADIAVKREQFKKASYLTNEAAVDADLARAKAEAEKSRLALEEARKNIELMRTESVRTSGQ